MRKRLVFTIVVAIVIFVAIVLIRAYYSNPPDVSTNTSTNSSSRSIVYDENPLLNNGVTSGQLSNMEQALSQYINSQGDNPGKVGFGTIKRTPPDPNIATPFSEITFTVNYDNKPTYKAKLDSFGTSEIRLYLYTLDGKTLLYDSQNVGGSSG